VILAPNLGSPSRSRDVLCGQKNTIIANHRFCHTTPQRILVWRFSSSIKLNFFVGRMQIAPAPQQVYPPQQMGYPPQQQMGYPPQQQMGYPPQQMQQFPPQQMGYPQQIQQVQMVPVMMVPVQGQQPVIDRSDLMNYEELLVKQTKKGWCQELMGCEANTEFKIAAKLTPTENVLYALEDTSCCIRFFLPNLRPFTMNLSKGGAPGGEKVASFERGLACPIHPCKICCYQRIDAFKAGVAAGFVQEGCYCLVPNFKVMKSDGTHQFDIHQPTCCGGCCVDICAEGCCNCRIPFYIYPPGASGDVGSQSGKIVKVSQILFLLPFPHPSIGLGWFCS
jgi:hypothetical protein